MLREHVEGSTGISILQLRVQRGASIGGKCPMFQKNCQWANQLRFFKLKLKCCDHTHDLVNTNHNMAK